MQSSWHMIAQGPPRESAGFGVYKIIGDSSIAAFKSFQTLGIYSASKWVVRGLTQAMAMESAPHEIAVNYAHGILDTRCRIRSIRCWPR
ncbi:hypothetical protein V1507DRAFT_468130 [Lipomyces tetrasporus]